MSPISSIRHARQASLAALALAAFASLSAPAHAGQTVGTIDLELNVTNACAVNGASSVQSDIGSAGKITFADQPGTFASVDGQFVGSLGNLSILCSPGSTPVLTVGAGNHDSSGSHYLNSGTSNVAYRLFTDAARTDEITIGRQIALGTATSAAIAIPIYARATHTGSVLPAGKYTDTVQIVLTF